MFVHYCCLSCEIYFAASTRGEMWDVGSLWSHRAMANSCNVENKMSVVRNLLILCPWGRVSGMKGRFDAPSYPEWVAFWHSKSMGQYRIMEVLTSVVHNFDVFLLKILSLGREFWLQFSVICQFPYLCLTPVPSGITLISYVRDGPFDILLGGEGWWPFFCSIFFFCGQFCCFFSEVSVK